MPPWLQGGFAGADAHPPGVLLFRLVLAAALGGLVSAVYRRTNGGEALPSFRATLILLTILIAAVTQVIGDNIARAFSLVGALSIVRFRTVVQDTRDTAFVIFAVTMGMAVGAGDLWVAGLAFAVTATAAMVVAGAFRVRSGDAPAEGYQLAVAMALGYSAETTLPPILTKHVERSRVVAVATANRGASVETTWEVRLRPGSSPADLVHDLSDAEGVQSVRIRLLETQP